MILVDDTVLTNFALIGQLGLLRLAFGDTTLRTTSKVCQEFKKGARKGVFQETDIRWLKNVRLSTRERQRYEMLCRRFGVGEASCLAVALERGVPLATDDWKARNLLRQFGGGVTGTLGILKKLVLNGRLSIEEGDQILGLMIEEGYFSPVEHLTEIL